MTGRLPISLLCALVWGQLSNAVPADPTITAAPVMPRQNGDRFIGWVSSSGTWTSESCNAGLTWYQDGTYAQCCPTTLASCYAPTACVDGYLIYPYSDLSSTTTIHCTDNFGDPSFSICNTAFIYESFGGSDRQTDIVCGASSVNWSYYRNVPSSLTETSSTSKTSTSSDDPTSTGSGTAASATGTGTTLPEPIPKKEKSKAWIAGAVVGPVIGLALIGAVVFFLIHRRKKNQPQQPAHGAAAVAPAAQPPVAQYTDAKPAFSPHASSYGQPSPGFNGGDPYNQYGQQPTSPAPQYTAPYVPPGSPPPQGHYAPDQKQTFQHVDQTQSHPRAAELGGVSSPVSTSNAHTAELSGDAIQRQT